MKYLSAFLFLFFSVLNAQHSQKELIKFCQVVNENISKVQSNQKKLKKLPADSDERLELTYYSFLTPFIEYEFEVLKPFSISNEGLVSMEIKYSEPETPFIYSVKGNIEDVVRSIVDIYFVLEFEPESLLIELTDLNSGRKETYNDSLLHLGIDQSGLVFASEKAGIRPEIY